MAPPTLRERFADLQEKVATKQVTVKELEKEGHSGFFRVAISFAILIGWFIVVVGLAAKYGAVHGHVLPGMVSG